MRYGLGQRFETERVKKIIEHNSQKVDYVVLCFLNTEKRSKNVSESYMEI